MTLVHIYRPPVTQYVARGRYRGHRKYVIIKQTKSRKLAFAEASKWLAEGDSDRKRADVLACFEWHDPSAVVEMVKP